MAHIETVQTGLRVITHVRGRVYRHEAGVKNQPAPKLKPQAHRRRRVCLLDAKGAEWLETYGITQPCFGELCNHQHFTRARIDVLVESGSLRWVGGSENVATWDDARYLAITPSGPVSTVQLRHGG